MQRAALLVLGVVALLAVGLTGGLLIGSTSKSELAVPAPDSVDVGFLQDMVMHHQQAITMASWERDNSTDPALKNLAYDIEATQTGQVGRMQGWLELWGAAQLPSGTHMAWMAGPAAHDHSGSMDAPSGGVATMPGMASAEELRALRSTTGPQLDVLFLQLMLRHHEGGASMLKYAAENATQPAVRNLASNMLGSQTNEANYLRQLLTARGGTPLPM